MLLILQMDPSYGKYVILTVQPRIAVVSPGFVELPAGMLDNSGMFTGAAALETRKKRALR